MLFRLPGRADFRQLVVVPRLLAVTELLVRLRHVEIERRVETPQVIASNSIRVGERNAIPP